jgi:hypothetical protein
MTKKRRQTFGERTEARHASEPARYDRASGES